MPHTPSPTVAAHSGTWSTPTAAGDARRHRAGLKILAVAFLVMMAFSALPTPLYVLYQQRDGFGTAVITWIFAVYAVGVAASLLFAGHVSDRVGRVRMLRWALAFEAGAAVLFIVWPDLPGLLIARVLTGVGVGILTPTATAHISELHARRGGAPNPARAATIAGLMNMSGFALGPLSGGLLAQTGVAPLTTPYVIFLVLFVLILIATSRVPETTNPTGRYRYAPQRLSLPAAAPTRFAAACLGAAVAFSINGLLMSLTPTILGEVMGWTSRAAAGAVPFAAFAPAAAVPPLITRLDTHRQSQLALVGTPLGLTLLAGSVVLSEPLLFVLAAVVAGATSGILFRVSMATAGELAPADRRGEVMAVAFLAAYLGLAVPVLAIGGALQLASLTTVVVVFAALAAVAVVLAVTASKFDRRAG